MSLKYEPASVTTTQFCAAPVTAVWGRLVPDFDCPDYYFSQAICWLMGISATFSLAAIIASVADIASVLLSYHLDTGAIIG